MEKQEFMQLTENQQLDYLNQVVTNRYGTLESNLVLENYKHVSKDNDIGFSISWEAPYGLYDESDAAYFWGIFKDLFTGILFNVWAHSNGKDAPILVVHYYVYF